MIIGLYKKLIKRNVTAKALWYFLVQEEFCLLAEIVQGWYTGLQRNIVYAMSLRSTNLVLQYYRCEVYLQFRFRFARDDSF